VRTRDLTATPAASGPLPGTGVVPRARLIFAIVSIALFMSSVDQTIVATALPTLQHDLHTPVNLAGWTITVYTLGQVVAMPLTGKISDQYGRKRVFLVAVVLFTASSLCCGFAGNIYLLIVLRALQAVGGGAFMPSATGIVADAFGAQRDRAVGLFVSIFPIGGVVGPLLGGLFVTYWSWRGIFLVNVPIGVLLIGLCWMFIPASAPGTRSRLDIRGVLLLGSMLLLAMVGVTYLGLARSSPASPWFLVPELAAAALLVLFVRHTFRAKAPFIPARFLRGQGFGVMNLINFLYGAAAVGFGALVPLYAQERYHLRPLDAATLLTARAVGMIIVAGLAVALLRRTGYRKPMLAGFAALSAGMFMMACAPPGLSPYAWLALGAGVCGVASGVLSPAANNATLQLAPESTAAIAGLRGMFRQAGSIVAVSLSTAIIARSSDPGLAQAHVFFVIGIITLGVLPLVFLVPEHHGGW
jgi:EmrB/QacA subfamily drug resistance transporter